MHALQQGDQHGYPFLYAAAKKEKELEIEKIIDPFMPTIEAECENCGYDRAFYFIMPDKAETKVVIQLTCARMVGGQLRCGQTWVLDEASDLLETRLGPRRKFFGN